MPIGRRILGGLAAILLVALPALAAGPPTAGGVIGHELTAEARAALEGNAEPDSPEGVDRLLSGITDAQARAILREELLKGVEARADVDQTPMLLERLDTRLREMLDTIGSRATRWEERLANISERLPTVRERLALAAHGTGGMLAAAGVIILAGLAAALITSRATQSWRARLAEAPRRAGYLTRLGRTLALGITQFIAIVVFVAATRFTAAALPDALGPLNEYVWIYHAGISAGWLLILLSRCVLAPGTPAIRITPLPDAAAAGLHRAVRLAAYVGIAGWLVAGLSPTLGFGFPLAIVIVALSGTLIGFGLLVGIALRWSAIQATVASILARGGPLGTGAQLLVQAAPALLSAYVLGAGAYWIGHWLERGQHEIAGPVGTLLILLVLPALDAAAHEIGRAVTGPTPRGRRYGEVIHRTLRLIIVLAAFGAVLHLWHLPVFGLLAGTGADPVLSAIFKIILTLIVARLAWQLIDATFHEDPLPTGHDSEEEAAEEMGEATRLRTLVPLLRVVLLIVIGLVAVMMLLSSVGVDIGPLLASAGILGLALGFGAQSLVRDIFSGAFYLIDDAFRIGEYIEIDENTRGEVESMSIRSLRLRHHRGPVVTLPFGELTKVINHNRDWVIYKMEFRMEPDTDPLQVKKVVKEVGKALLAHPEHGPKFLEPLKSQGVLMIDDDSALVMRVKFKCRPRAQFVLRREIYHALQKAFRENGIMLARRKVEVVSSGADAAAALDDEPLAARPDD